MKPQIYKHISLICQYVWFAVIDNSDGMVYVVGSELQAIQPDFIGLGFIENLNTCVAFNIHLFA